MNSMTGYGKGIAERDGRKVTIEFKSVNHRFLDILFKLPRNFQFVEDALRKLIGERITRGHVEVYLSYEDNRENKTTISINEELAKAYLDARTTLVKMGYDDNLGVAELLKIPDIVKQTATEDDEEIIRTLVVEAGELALDGLIAMRRTEGKKLIEDLKNKLTVIESEVQAIATRAPLVASVYREKLIARVSEALQGSEIDEQRIAQEVTFFIDKSNIDEELTRLRGHIAHYAEIMEVDEPIGKKLDFLTQETNREVNTIGSKSNDAIITKSVLFLKNQVEMVREQVQNLE